MRKPTDWTRESLPPWVQVGLKYQRPEPCKPLMPRSSDLRSHVSGLLGYAGATIHFPDYAGRQIAVGERFIKYLASKPPNHTAYVGWIASALLAPHEVWEHADPNNKADSTPRRYYLACFGVNFVAICLPDNRLMNAFIVARVSTMHKYRCGTLHHVGYI